MSTYGIHLWYDTVTAKFYFKDGNGLTNEFIAGGGGSIPDDVSKLFSFYDGKLVSMTSLNGTKTFNYTGDKLTSITATGSYNSKTITYNLDGSVQSVTVL